MSCVGIAENVGSLTGAQVAAQSIDWTPNYKSYAACVRTCSFGPECTSECTGSAGAASSAGCTTCQGRCINNCSGSVLVKGDFKQCMDCLETNIGDVGKCGPFTPPMLHVYIVGAILAILTVAFFALDSHEPPLPPYPAYPSRMRVLAGV